MQACTVDIAITMTGTEPITIIITITGTVGLQHTEQGITSQEQGMA